MKIPNIFEEATPPLHYAAGATVFVKGDAGDSMFSVKSGEVELSVNGKVIETVCADGFFGEMALIEDEARSATATAKTGCVLVPISRKRFEFMVHETPGFAVQIMQVLSRRLRGKNI